MMTRTAKTYRQKEVKGRAQRSLIDSLGTVSAVLEAQGDVVTMPGNLTQAFLLTDAVLAGINRQLLDARANIAAIIQEFGYGDPLAEALMYQMAALERAYCERLYALRKKREEGDKGITAVSTEKTMMPDVRQHQESSARQNHGAMWSLAILFLMHRNSASSRKRGGLVLNAA